MLHTKPHSKLSSYLPEIIERYSAGESASSLGKFYNVSAGTVIHLLKRWSNLQTRDLETSVRGENILYDWFDVIDNPLKAYFIGFIVADGGVRDDQLRLTSKDLEIITTLKASLNADNRVEYIERDSTYEIRIGCKYLLRTLAKYDITKHKSTRVRFAYNIPEAFIPAYLLGIFDGDGCFSYKYQFHNYDKIYPQFLITSPDLIFLEECRDYLRNVLGLYKGFNMTHYVTWHNLVMASFKTCIPLYDLVYNKSGCNFYLKRKRLAAERALRMI